MQLNRTDIHSPKSIIPTNYRFVSCLVPANGYDTQFALTERKRLSDHMAQSGGNWAQHEHGGTCMVCGAHAIYRCVFYHALSNEYLVTGEDCAHKLEMDADFNVMATFRRDFSAWREFQAGKTKAQGLLEERGLFDAWIVYETPYEQLPKDSSGLIAYEARTIYDIVSKVVKYGNISERQSEFVRSLLQRIAERPAREARLAELKAKSQFVGNVGDRITVTATVRAVKECETAYGLSYFTVLSDKDGNTFIWFGKGFDAEKGTELTFKATVKRHEEKQGEKQTHLTRCALLEAPQPV